MYLNFQILYVETYEVANKKANNFGPLKIVNFYVIFVITMPIVLWLVRQTINIRSKKKKVLRDVLFFIGQSVTNLCIYPFN